MFVPIDRSEICKGGGDLRRRCFVEESSLDKTHYY